MNEIIVKVGDTIKLFNGTEGIIGEIDRTTYQFTLSDQYMIWFHLRDIKILNGQEIDSDLLEI